MSRSVVTRSVGLLQVHSVGQSADEPAQEEENESREDDVTVAATAIDQPQCYFTITSDDGEVHVFETASPEDCTKLVRGMQHLIARFSSQVVRGDTSAIMDFYNLKDPAEIRFTPEEAMMRVSHSFLAC